MPDQAEALRRKVRLARQTVPADPPEPATVLAFERPEPRPRWSAPDPRPKTANPAIVLFKPK